MNVYDEAHSLARAIKESNEFKEFDKVRIEVDNDKECSSCCKISSGSGRVLPYDERCVQHHRGSNGSAVKLHYGKYSGIDVVSSRKKSL